MKHVLVFALAAIALAGCAMKVPVVTPEIRGQMLTDLKSGNAYLDCKIACTASWEIGGHEKAARLFNAQNWEELAVSVLQIGYQEDLGYFYLGRAAEGLGADEAALKYYRVAGAIATGPDISIQCAGTTCDGFTFPQALYPRMAMVEANIARREAALHPAPPPPTTPHRRHGTAAPQTTTTAAAAPDNSWITPPPITR